MHVCACVGVYMCDIKTKLLLADVGLSPVDVAPLQLTGGAVEVVRKFKYLGSLVEATDRMTGEIDQHIVQVSKAFDSLCIAVFLAHDLSLETTGRHIALWCWECFCMVQNMGTHTGFG